MTVSRARLTPSKLWTLIFGVWLLFVSGALAGVLGSPGIIQALRLGNLLETKKAELAQIESEIRRIEEEAALLDKSPIAQHREVRKVLGYAAEDELIFDFSQTTEVGSLR